MQTFSIKCATWNVNGQIATQNDVRSWLAKGQLISEEFFLPSNTPKTKARASKK